MYVQCLVYVVMNTYCVKNFYERKHKNSFYNRKSSIHIYRHDSNLFQNNKYMYVQKKHIT